MQKIKKRESEAGTDAVETQSNGFALDSGFDLAFIRAIRGPIFGFRRTKGSTRRQNRPSLW
jgi:hypothetical protein